MTRSTRSTTAARTRATARAGAFALLAGVGLTACAPELPQPAPEGPPAVPPAVVTLDQSTRILDQVGEVLATADASRSAADLAPRVSGPALTSRTAEYTVATATGDATAVTALPVTPQTLVVASTTDWPRTQLVVTEQPEDLSSPRLLVLRQESPRSPYALWGWVRLLPGVQMPATASPETGSEPVPADATTLVAAPTDVVAQYADVLGNGAASAFAASFATPDSYREQIEAARARNQASAAEGAGTFTETYAAVPDQVVALATADGGAIVVGGMTTASALTITGASLAVPPQFAAVSGGALPAGAVLRNNLSVAYTDVVAFYVPPAGAAAPIQVLGGEHTFTSASGS